MSMGEIGCVIIGGFEDARRAMFCFLQEFASRLVDIASQSAKASQMRAHPWGKSLRWTWQTHYPQRTQAMPGSNISRPPT
ncbi:hypothetical protein SOQ14_04540 [Erythrobacter sp. T5W1-R]|uniref:hypothetical protein n=1 Tax=Erythrobacter sp. T5W1-R TaxID=3101752 RepID=UPI002AFFDFA7|nr:hypothetical protein [Erythrobacter sp. T5W1-R]MEA1618181.1 hypothetical protein [Erythrobacter sp. T5W1-R]